MKIQGPTISALECVAYERKFDTHAIASVTIPITGEYKILGWDDIWRLRHCKAGEVIHSLKALTSPPCPGYNDIKAIEAASRD